MCCPKQPIICSTCHKNFLVTYTETFVIVKSIGSGACRYCCRLWARIYLSGVPIGALLAVLQHWLFGCVCVSQVSGWLGLAEVFAVLPLGVSCFLSCRVGRYFVARWNVGAQAGCFIAAFDCRWPPRHARTRRVLEVGSQWHGCKCS